MRLMHRFAVLTFLLGGFLASPPAHAAQEQGINSCRQNNSAIAGLAMTSSRSFTIDLGSNGSTDALNRGAGFGLLTVWLDLTDGNTSITRFDVTCTVSNDGNVKDYTPQVCDDTSDGVCTQTDAGIWQKASPGTKMWPLRMDIEGYPDIACTASVGTGSAAAADLLTAGWRICTKG